jgi:NAD(P)-dependent dehydrogenase (short-subunit alcohol dehydrogenase family)
MMLLKDKVVIINGVGPGMGQALARIAAREGAKVALAARNSAFLNEVKAGIENEGGQAAVIPCDITDAAQCQRLAEATAETFGGIDGIVNSAYYHGEWSSVESADEEDWHKAFDVGCLGALRVTRAALPFLKQRGGAVVNVSTMATVRPYGMHGFYEMGYAVAKGGLNVLSKYMATDLGQHGIRVNTCRLGWIGGAPVQGWIDSEVANGRDRDEVIASVTKDIPLGVIPPEDDCARAVLMYLSDYAKVVNGAIVDINGGNWMAP